MNYNDISTTEEKEKFISMLIGQKWGQIDDNIKIFLLSNAYPYLSGEYETENEECIVDLTLYPLSINGFYNHESGEITINNNAIIYNSEK